MEPMRRIHPERDASKATGTLEDAHTVIVVDVRKTVGILLAVTIAIVITAIGLGFAKSSTNNEAIHRIGLMFLLTGEANIPTWFSTCLLSTAVLVLLIIAQSTRPEAGEPSAAYWYGLAGVFAYLSLDELAEIHEQFPNLLSGDAAQQSGLFHYGWVTMAALLVLLVAGAFIPLLLKIPRATALRFIVAGVVFVGAALGLEMLESLVLVSGLYSADATSGIQWYAMRVLTTLEEAGEMIGVILFIRALLLYIPTRASGVSGAVATSSRTTA